MPIQLECLKRWMVAGIIALSVSGPVTSFAKTTGVTSDSTLESGPCYLALVDKNAETPSTAPNRELGDACRVENGDIDKAWARIIRLWGSDTADVPDYDSFVHADAAAPGTIPIWLALVSIVLMYGVAATPMRAAAALMRGAGSRGPLAAECVVSLMVRGAVGLLLLAVFSISVATLVGCGLLSALLVHRLMFGRVALRPVQSHPDDARPNGLSLFVADVINDVAGGAVGLLGLALLANHSLGLFAGALLIAVLLSAPPLLVIRRTICLQPIALTGMTAFLVASTAVSALSEPLITASLGSFAYVGFAVPVVLALAVIGLGWRTWGTAMMSFRT